MDGETKPKINWMLWAAVGAAAWFLFFRKK